jgi:hypothetical protein
VAGRIFRTRAGSGEQFRDDNLAAPPVGKGDVIGGRPSDKMDDVAALRGVPPANVVRLDAGLLQGRLRLEKLLLKAPVCQGKRRVMVEQDFHFKFNAALSSAFSSTESRKPPDA